MNLKVLPQICRTTPETIAQWHQPQQQQQQQQNPKTLG